MIEPTESESKAELDRFCNALIAIRGEIEDIEGGRVPRDNNVLKVRSMQFLCNHCTRFANIILNLTPYAS